MQSIRTFKINKKIYLATLAYLTWNNAKTFACNQVACSILIYLFSPVWVLSNCSHKPVHLKVIETV